MVVLASYASILCDEDINTIVTPTTPAAIHTGPITRARARQLNYHILPFLGNDSNVHENMMLPKLDTFVLLTNEGPSLQKDEHWNKTKHGDDGMRKENKNGVHEALDEIYKMPLHKFHPEAILGVASPYYVTRPM